MSLWRCRVSVASPAESQWRKEQYMSNKDTSTAWTGFQCSIAYSVDSTHPTAARATALAGGTLLGVFRLWVSHAWQITCSLSQADNVDIIWHKSRPGAACTCLWAAVMTLECLHRMVAWITRFSRARPALSLKSSLSLSLSLSLSRRLKATV